MRTYCFTDLIAGQEEEAEFEIETCGGVTIWNNDKIVTDYIPFTRNMVKHTSIKIPLKEGKNKFIICLDDLAERDTDYYFRLKYQGTQELSIQLPVPDGVETEKVLRYEKILDNICFEKETYISEPVTLSLPGHLLENEQLKMSIANGEWVEKMQHEGEEDTALSYELKKVRRNFLLWIQKIFFLDFTFLNLRCRKALS